MEESGGRGGGFENPLLPPSFSGRDSEKEGFKRGERTPENGRGSQSDGEGFSSALESWERKVEGHPA